MPTVLKKLHIAEGVYSSIYDYRQETPANGGVIKLQGCVWHIPVIRQMDGREDLDALRRILMDKDLMVQFGTDGEGNVALYTRANRLCYQARGANAISCGVEQMHLTVGDPWSKKEFRAAGWIMQYLEREFGIPLQMADVEPGGFHQAKFVRKGHTSHEQISRMAGYNDREDPGDGMDYEYCFHCARFFGTHGHFVGA